MASSTSSEKFNPSSSRFRYYEFELKGGNSIIHKSKPGQELGILFGSIDIVIDPMGSRIEIEEEFVVLSQET